MYFKLKWYELMDIVLNNILFIVGFVVDSVGFIGLIVINKIILFLNENII